MSFKNVDTWGLGVYTDETSKDYALVLRFFDDFVGRDDFGSGSEGCGDATVFFSGERDGALDRVLRNTFAMNDVADLDAAENAGVLLAAVAGGLYGVSWHPCALFIEDGNDVGVCV